MIGELDLTAVDLQVEAAGQRHLLLHESVEERQAVLTVAHAWRALRGFLPFREKGRWLVSFGKR